MPHCGGTRRPRLIPTKENNMKIKKNDRVIIISGKDKAQKGKIIRALPEKNKVVVEGLNLVTRHRRPQRQGEKGQRVRVSMPIDVSNVKLICPKCKKATRVNYKKIEKKKFRICKKCGQEI